MGEQKWVLLDVLAELLMFQQMLEQTTSTHYGKLLQAWLRTDTVPIVLITVDGMPLQAQHSTRYVETRYFRIESVCSMQQTVTVSLLCPKDEEFETFERTGEQIVVHGSTLSAVQILDFSLLYEKFIEPKW